MDRTEGIEIYEANPAYWAFGGRPTLLVGGSDDENVFQWPEAEMLAHLDLLKEVGGNYDRCTLSSRPDRGFEIYPFLKAEDGRYDLSQWNQEFWTRLERYLRACDERGIVVQLEIWATYDLTSRWSDDAPYNPGFNVNYEGPPETILGDRYVQYREESDFYRTVPTLQNDVTVLSYQRAFVDRALSCAFAHDNILYCIDNEYAFVQPWQWFRYWAEYIRQKAREADKTVQVSEMNLLDWELDRALVSGGEISEAMAQRLGTGTDWYLNSNHREVFDNPSVYGYVDFSENADKRGQQHWDNLCAVRSYLSAHRRPINHTKIYGADFGVKWNTQDGINAFWRNVCGGAASVRFHRPPTGIGLSSLAQANIKAMRKFEEAVRPWECEPYPEGLLFRDEDSAYAIANPGKAYGLFFPGSREPAWVKLVAYSDGVPLTLRWISLSTGEWGDAHTFIGNQWEGNVITAPMRGSDHGWAAAIVAGDGEAGEKVLADYN